MSYQQAFLHNVGMECKAVLEMVSMAGVTKPAKMPQPSPGAGSEAVPLGPAQQSEDEGTSLIWHHATRWVCSVQHTVVQLADDQHSNAAGHGQGIAQVHSQGSV